MSLPKALLEEITFDLQEILQSGKEGAEDIQKNIQSLFNTALKRANLVSQDSFTRLENIVQKLALEVVELKNKLETLKKAPSPSTTSLPSKNLSQVPSHSKAKKGNTRAKTQTKTNKL